MATGVSGTSSGYECERLAGAGQKSLRSVLNATGPCKQSRRQAATKKLIKTINYAYTVDVIAAGCVSSAAPAYRPGFDEKLTRLAWRSAAPGMAVHEFERNGHRLRCAATGQAAHYALEGRFAGQGPSSRSKAVSCGNAHDVAKKPIGISVFET